MWLNRRSVSRLSVAIALALIVGAGPGDDGQPGKILLRLGELRVAVSPDGRTLATCNRGRGLTLWDLPARRPKGQLATREQVVSVAYAPDGKTLAAGDVYGDILLWDVESGTIRRALRAAKTFGEVMSQTVGCHSLTFSPDGRTLASGIGPGVDLWDVDRGEVRIRLTRRAPLQDSVAFSPDGTTLATLSSEVIFPQPLQRETIDEARVIRKVHAFDASTGRERWATEIEKIGHSLAFSPDGRTLFATGSEPALIALNTLDGRPRPDVGRDDQSGEVLALSRDGRFLACGEFGGIALHDARSGRLLRRVSHVDRLNGSLDETRDRLPFEINALAFSRDGRILIVSSGYDDAPITFWDVEEMFDIHVEL